ncbi:MAG TPA: hypothetical protein VFG87_00345 [Amycolatopsis sp.]|nr:hypothetical protein [Amycolatopsis sp.]
MRKMVPGAEVGVEVYDQQTDTVLTSLDPTEQFPTMSVVKLLIAIDVLHQNNWVLPDQDEQQEITRMLSYSDDAIASELWEQQGGGALVTRDAALMGLKNTVPPTSDPGEWGDTRTTAQDLVTVYQYVADGMPTADHDLIYTAMFHAAQTAADGTDQYFGIPDGLPGTTWAIKQGWGSSGPKDVVNTTGLVGSDSRYVVIVLTTGSSSDHKMESAITSATAQLASLVPKS